MNGRKAKELRRKAHNEWIKLKPMYQKQFTVKQICKVLKRDPNFFDKK